MPGILDSHHHIIEPFVKALTGGERAQLWKRFWLPLEASLTEGTAYLGAAWTFLEAMRGGITTIVDHGIRTREIANAIHRAAADTGIRLVSFRAIFLSADPPERGVEASYETVRRWVLKFGPAIARNLRPPASAGRSLAS
jgi:5-methylthioadenosine/S-adenosylhomocysteine deaminase